MRRAIVLLSLVILASGVLLPTSAVATVVAPPAINLPGGAKVVTEINLSDEDVLGIVKASIPVIADALKSLAPSRAGENTPVPAWVSAIDLNEFSEAISGVHGVRIVIAHYATAIKPEKFVEQFNAGVTKTGQFDKLLTDIGTLPIAAGLYAEPDNAGMIGFAYDPEQRRVYAIRIVGGVDLPKLIHWAGETAKLAIGAQPHTQTPQPGAPAK